MVVHESIKVDKIHTIHTSHTILLWKGRDVFIFPVAYSIIGICRLGNIMVSVITIRSKVRRFKPRRWTLRAL
jgi:hypothetical protein